MKNNFVSIGKILNFHGVKGEAKLGYTKNREEFLSNVDVVYMKIVEMQNREPKKWVNKEFDLFLAAKKELEY